MKFLKFTGKFGRSFSARVLFMCTVFIVIIAVSFTSFFILHQSVSLKDTMVRDGESLTKLFAYNIRLGVFSENEYFLKDPVDGILQHREVLSVVIFTNDGKLLKEQENPAKKGLKRSHETDFEHQKKIFESLRESKASFYGEGADTFEFWAPVLSRTPYSTEESLFFDETLSHNKDYVIGFVRVVFDKTPLHEKIMSLLFKSILIAAAFLLLGFVVTYLTVKNITKPLSKLTESVKILGTGKFVEKVPIDTDDEIGKLATAFNDMAESLRKREEEKQLLEAQLRHAQKMEAVGQLAGGIAHDFNNILTAIIGYATLLQIKIPKDDPLRRNVDQILASSDRAATLTKSLLSFSRKHVINLNPVKINGIIEMAEKLLLRLIGEDIELKTVLTDKELVVMADSGMIEQVLMNLATNARDAMPNGGFLHISTDYAELDEEYIRTHGYGKTGKYVLISVTDTGEGMDEKTRERIFEPFFTTKGVGKGTGLGLSIAYAIIKQHHGYINIYSELGRGTSFKIYLPLTEQKVEERKPAEYIAPIGGKETILMAEDDEEVRKFSKNVLEEFGYTVIEAVDGDDAVNKFMDNKDSIDLLMLDVIMPKKDGKEVYEKIKTIRPDIKVLFLSGYPKDVTDKKGLLEEGLNFALKPISPTELLGKIRKLANK